MRAFLVMAALLVVGCSEPEADRGREPDGGGASRDAGVETDAGAGEPDAAAPERDAGATIPDAGPRDASEGTPSPDAGPLDAGPVDPLAGAGEATRIAGGFEFVEGPLWYEGALLFSDIPAGTIYAIAPPGSAEVFRRPSNASNGLAVLPDGRLLAAEHATRRVSVTEPDGRVVALVERFEGARFNSPNDLVARSDGTVYFTDPPFGLTGPRELDFNGLFRVTPDGRAHAEWRGTIDSRPNGVALSPDERVLYVDDTAAALVRAYDVAPDGSTSGERIFATGTPNADGMTVDAHGNLYVSTNDGVAVFAPDGARWGTLPIPQVPTNCAFGGDGRTLYVTAGGAVYAVRLPAAQGPATQGEAPASS